MWDTGGCAGTAQGWEPVMCDTLFTGYKPELRGGSASVHLISGEDTLQFHFIAQVGGTFAELLSLLT